MKKTEEREIKLEWKKSKERHLRKAEVDFKKEINDAEKRLSISTV